MQGGRHACSPGPRAWCAQGSLRPQLLPTCLLPSAMAKFAGPRLPLVMKVLFATQSSVYEVQRITSTAFLAEVGALALDHEWRGEGGSVKSPHRQAWVGQGSDIENPPQTKAVGAREGLGSGVRGG